MQEKHDRKKGKNTWIAGARKSMIERKERTLGDGSSAVNHNLRMTSLNLKSFFFPSEVERVGRHRERKKQ